MDIHRIGPAGLPEGGSQETRHTVGKGDTLNHIAEQYGVLPEAILEANPQIKDPSQLQPGQILQIPRSGENLAANLFPGIEVSKDVIEQASPQPDFFQRLSGGGELPEAPPAGPDAAQESELTELVAQGLQRAAPPYVPVQPVVGSDNIATPGHLLAGGEVNELNLTADQFQINEEGNLVITNEKLIEFFKSLKGSSAEQEFHLGIMKMKPPGEE